MWGCGGDDYLIIYHRDKVIQIYENELNRLNDKLQLMQTVTRREFVKHRLYAPS